jgi:hypothetical protein
VPAGHVVRQLYGSATGSSRTIEPTPPAEGSLWFDGDPARPVDRPTLALWLRADGSVATSAYLWPQDALFAYPTRSAPAVAVAAPRARTGRPSRWLAIAAGGAVAAGAATYVLAARSHDAFWDPTTPDAEVEGLRARTNALFVASMSLGGVALGAGAGAVLVGRW